MARFGSFLWLVVILWPAFMVEAQVVHTRAESLLEARQGFSTKLVRNERQTDPLPMPPEDLFSVVYYDAPSGPTAAYLSVMEKSDRRRPAILWLTGGFPVARGGDVVWSPREHDNEQSASAYRKAGVIMMFPTMRGTCNNPGYQEVFMGEVEDVIAAATYLSKLDTVDPKQIYLGGHSTGGTLALLVAESTDLFRAVFCFGPAANMTDYGTRDWPFDSANPIENAMRSPISFLNALSSPTLVMEGEKGRHAQLQQLKNATNNPRLQCVLIMGADHFNILAPINRWLANKISKPSKGPFVVNPEELQGVYQEFWLAQRQAQDLRLLAKQRSDGRVLGQVYSIQYRLFSYNREPLQAAMESLQAAGYSANTIHERTNEDGETYFALPSVKRMALSMEAIFKCSREVKQIAEENSLFYRDWEIPPNRALF